MGSRTNLVALSLIAAALAVVVVIDRSAPGSGVKRSDRVIPELVEASVSAISVSHADGDRFVLGRDGLDAPFRLVSPVSAPVDEAAAADLVGTIELLSFRRRAGDRDRAELGLSPPRATLEIRFTTADSKLPGNESVVLELGNRIDALDKVWLARKGQRDVFLIDGYAARSLARRAAELRSRRALRTRDRDVTGLEVHAGDQSLVLSGRPLAVHLAAGGAVRVDPMAGRALLARMDDLRISRFVDDASDRAALVDGIVIRVIGQGEPQELSDLGDCPGADDQRLVRSAVGTGCVDQVSLLSIAAVSGLREALFDRHLIAYDNGAVRLIVITSPAGVLSIDASGAGWKSKDGSEVDATGVRAWLGAVSELSSGATVPASELDKATELGRIEVGYSGGRTDRLRFVTTRRGRFAIRDDEPVAFAVDAAVRRLVDPDPLRFRPRQITALDPYSLREAIATRRGAVVARIERGELLQDWTVHAPAGNQPDFDAIGRLREELARLRAVRFVATKAAPAHGLDRPRRRVEARFDAPTPGGDRVVHTLDIGAKTDAGCYARLASDPAVFELAQATCDVITSPWSRSK